MKQDLTSSNVQRQNILNNRYALKEIENQVSFGGIKYRNEVLFIKQQVASILDVDERTIDRYISSHLSEISQNGYKLLKGRQLKEFKEAYVDDIYVVDISKAPQIGVFTFKTVLNLAMLLVESEKARQIRSKILDIVINTIAKKVGDPTYINQRDTDYLPAAFQEDNYRKTFTNAIAEYIDIEQQWKYGKYTNMIYKAIFEENAKEYREVLKLRAKDNVRDTFYAEILDLVSSYELGYAEELKKAFEKKKRKLSTDEADKIFKSLTSHAAFIPLVNKARTIMASRDCSLRDAIHEKLEAYIHAMPEADYEKFLGEKSKELEERIKESLDVYKRLKDR